MPGENYQDKEQMKPAANMDWDDGFLVEAFKQALKDKKQCDGWKIGDRCRALYHEDGLYYEARIKNINNDQATVEFVGYGDEDVIMKHHLKKSAGRRAWQNQEKEAKYQETFGESHSSENGGDQELQNKKNDSEFSDCSVCKSEDECVWKDGDYCRALYHLDGLYYEARIKSIHKDQATIEFIGYGNEDIVMKDHLKESAGKQARLDQENSAKCQANVKECESLCKREVQSNEKHAKHQDCVYGTSTYAPHPFTLKDDPSDSSVMSAWYAAGYTTGYYMGLQGFSQGSASCLHQVCCCCYSKIHSMH